MGFELFCATVIALLFGMAICFGGYRFFLVLLPIFGFFFGFALGAETLQAIFGVGMFASVTSWIVGFLVGACFALVSYFFYIGAVIVIAGALGFGLGVALMGLFNLDTLSFITWLVGIVLSVVVIGLTLCFNVQKYVIIVGTAVAGAALVIGTLVLGPGGVKLADLVANPVQVALRNSPIWTLLFFALAAAGIAIQVVANRRFEVQTYNRLAYQTEGGN